MRMDESFTFKPWYAYHWQYAEGRFGGTESYLLLQFVHNSYSNDVIIIVSLNAAEDS